MMNQFAKISTLTVGVMTGLMATTAFAVPAEAPNVFVKRVADQLTTRLKADAPKIKSNPALARQIIQQNIEPHIDTQGFTRTVLGSYAQASTPAQRATFEKNLKNSLINNYGGELAKYANNSYTMRPYTAGNPPVVTIDFINQGEKIPVSFKLVDKGSQWKIQNIDVAGINIGLTFRNQFQATVTKNGNNLDKAIATFQPNLDNVKK